jgi:hypothetical protein
VDFAAAAPGPTMQEALTDYNKRIKKSSSLRRIGRRRSSLIEEVRAYYLSGAEEAAKKEVEEPEEQALNLDPLRSALTGNNLFTVKKTQPEANAAAVRTIQHSLERQDLDPDFYSDKALLQRESLKFDPAIRRLLEQIFQLVDQNRDGRMDFKEYRGLFLALWRIVRGKKCDLNEVYMAAKKELKIDAFGKESLDKTQFKQLVFQIVDTWTESITVEDYCAFLQKLIDGLLVSHTE